MKKDLYIDLNKLFEVTWESYTEKDKLIRSLNILLEQYKILEKSFEEIKDVVAIKRMREQQANIIYWLSNVSKIKSKKISDLDNKEDLI